MSGGIIRVQRNIPPEIIRTVKKCLPMDKAFASGVSLVFVSALKMAELNRKYRGRVGATNILTFEEGDIALCPAVIAREAKSYGFTQKNWMTRLMVHGILHIIGYEHSAGMERLEEKIFGELGLEILSTKF